ncbi:MAG: hypothetical protein ACE5JM_03685 [Armatimonadota bacterium]
MRQRTVVTVVAVAAILAAIMLAGCGGVTRLGQVGTASFVGSDTCRGCHPAEDADVHDSGHPFKLNKVESGQPPTYPFSSVPNTPAGYSWNDVSYVIGGYGWKARFIDLDGYIVTGNAVQYNLATQQWAAYHSGDPPGTKPYTCGACHTTGWVATGAGGPHQDGLPGMHGTFSEPGITCEACHGPGSRHVQTLQASDITVDIRAERCGECHFRDSQHRIEASGGFIRHHEQYDEMIADGNTVPGHQDQECVDCHHPHRGSRYAGDFGLVRTCESCHPSEAASLDHSPGPECKDCHMPRATKSAVKVHDHEGDVRTHIFEINTAAVDKSAMWYVDGTKTFSHGFVTLDFACYGCHDDQSGVGGGNSQKTLAELSAAAIGIHN